ITERLCYGARRFGSDTFSALVDIHAVRWEEWRSSSSVEITTETIGSALNATDDARPCRESKHPVLSPRMAHRTARIDLAFFRSVFVDHGMRQPMVSLAAEHVVLPTHRNATTHVAHQLPGPDTFRYSKPLALPPHLESFLLRVPHQRRFQHVKRLLQG